MFDDCKFSERTMKRAICQVTGRKNATRWHKNATRYYKNATRSLRDIYTTRQSRNTHNIIYTTRYNTHIQYEIITRFRIQLRDTCIHFEIIHTRLCTHLVTYNTHNTYILLEVISTSTIAWQLRDYILQCIHIFTGESCTTTTPNSFGIMNILAMMILKKVITHMRITIRWMKIMQELIVQTINILLIFILHNNIFLCNIKC